MLYTYYFNSEQPDNSVVIRVLLSLPHRWENGVWELFGHNVCFQCFQVQVDPLLLTQILKLLASSQCPSNGSSPLISYEVDGTGIIISILQLQKLKPKETRCWDQNELNQKSSCHLLPLRISLQVTQGPEGIRRVITWGAFAMYEQDYRLGVQAAGSAGSWLARLLRLWMHSNVMITFRRSAGTVNSCFLHWSGQGVLSLVIIAIIFLRQASFPKAKL